MNCRWSFRTSQGSWTDRRLADVVMEVTKYGASQGWSFSATNAVRDLERATVICFSFFFARLYVGGKHTLSVTEGLCWLL